MNQCQAGHSDHDSFKIETSIGFMWVYNYERYKNVAGYCSGKDDVSRTLINTGAWEKPETEVIKRVLEDGDKNNYFWDLGCHIGWYTIIAAKLGYRVLAIDGDKNNLSLLNKNLAENLIASKVTVKNEWINAKSPYYGLAIGNIELVKIDIEGNEVYAIEKLWDLILAKRVNNLFIEFSPVFNNSYPEIYNKLTKVGYKAFIDGAPFNGDMNFNQANILFRL